MHDVCSPKITFIGAGSTIFVKNILGDVYHRARR
ncbi:hypothetical protein ACLB1E_02405 [Escherichia coli]